ncbi:hypothetical protein GXW82_03635 [Streptacidiphilus sp. 4-A2]|nr:hypothetical protein [Streptacidiphilus sp. 4-A2]
MHAADPSGASRRPYQDRQRAGGGARTTPDTRFAKGQEAQLAAALLDASGDVLVAWEHESIPAIVSHLGPVTPTPPDSWPDARFDMVWVFARNAGGWSFTQVPQMLLAGDLSTPIG